MISLALDEVRWPRKGDVLFADGDDWVNNACLNFVKGSNAVALYSVGYRTGAERLAKYVLAEHLEQDTLIYPIAFLWRHYVELRLKGLLRSARLLKDEDVDDKIDHRLLPLWQKLRPLLEEIEPDGDQETLGAVEEIVMQFDLIDTDSFAFRYPTTKRGAHSLPMELLHINIRNLTEVMQRVASFLDAVDTMLGVYLEHKAEMESYHRDIY